VTASRPRLDRAALVRGALVRLVAERGLSGASMADVAEAAGVAAGTIYVHYDSKDELILAAYCEVKAELGEVAAAAGASADVADPEARFREVWQAIYDYLAAHPARARFLAQVDASPHAGEAHQRATQGPGGKLLELAAEVGSALIDVPPVVLYELALGPAVRLAADGSSLDGPTLDRIVTACWRAITRA
jgi:AcrR family transcriptional regulator